MLCHVQELCQKIIKGVYSTPAYISSEVKDLLAHMLTVVPDHRITFDQVCRLCMYAKYDQSSMMIFFCSRCGKCVNGSEVSHA